MTTADLRDRWRTLQLLSPIFELLKRGAPRADIDHHRYDLAQLALRLIDYVVQNQASLEGSVSLDALMDHLTQIARQMYPDDPSRSANRVARLVFNSVFNDGQHHEAVWLEIGSGDVEPEEDLFRFKLVRMIDSDAGAAITATDEAILLYLRALSTDLADQALALKLMVEIQMQAGEFDKALDSAQRATRTARALAASLREKLLDTQRDVTAVDWSGDMPQWLGEVRDKIRQQIERDRQLLDLARQSGEDPSAELPCRRITDEVRIGWQVWTRLEEHLLAAIPTFLDAQVAQRFHPRGLAAVIDMTRDVFDPALSAPDAVFQAVLDVLVRGLAAPPTPVSWGLGEMTDLLFKPQLRYERRPPEVDDPGELSETPADSIPEHISRWAADVLATAAARPTRLSELLSRARQSSTSSHDLVQVLDVLWGAALWLFVEGNDAAIDERVSSADLAGAIAALNVAIDDRQLSDDRYQGPDVTLATSVALDALDLEALRQS